MKKGVLSLIVLFLALAMTSFISAGVGIKWSQESFLVNDGEETCLTYSVYNPWPEDSYVQIVLPENLKNLLIMQEAETKLVPANTGSVNAIPIKFCFKVPKVYAEECLIGDFLCKKECNEEQVVYEGQVSVKSVPGETTMTGSGGSATEMSVSAPLRLKLNCNAHPTDFTLLYLVLAIVALLGIIIILFRKYRKPEQARKKEKLAELREEMKKLKKKK